MRKLKLAMLVALSSACAGAYAQRNDAQVAAAAADEKMAIGTHMPFGEPPMLDARNNERIQLDSLYGPNGLLVMFSCNTCPYVVKSQARTKQIMALAAQKKVGFVIVNSNEARREDDDALPKMQEYAAVQGYTVPYIVDAGSQLADLFGATRTPEVYLFNAGHLLVYKGAMEDNPSSPKESKNLYLQNAINKLVAGQKIAPATTKSVGCSIKRR